MFKLNLQYFLISFAVGMLLVYVAVPKPKIIVKFPNPNNAEKTLYKDDNEQCYKYKVETVPCVGEVKDQPIEENFIRKVVSG